MDVENFVKTHLGKMASLEMPKGPGSSTVKEPGPVVISNDAKEGPSNMVKEDPMDFLSNAKEIKS